GGGSAAAPPAPSAAAPTPSGGSGGGPSGGPGASGSGGGGGGGGAGGGGPSAPGNPGESSGPRDDQTCQGGHPVNLVTGDVVDRALDLEMPGPVPVRFERFYSSARCADSNASLGPGWAH